MSTRDFFKNSGKLLISKNVDELGKEVESREYIEAYIKRKNEFIPLVDFDNPATFAKYGSAQKYYETSMERVYKTYYNLE